ncbi:hypothetical protein WMY93_006302 [Mugilogobius chulae]|uniref:N-acetylmuramoyl-L-alanine amidase n=1 Tax=Mugilogobius chulae TaxID=88201 RepID=A0AAW0PM12_9GOBI
MFSVGLLFFSLTFLGYFPVYSTSAGHLRNMDSLIRAVKQVEEANPGLSPLALVRALRRIAGHDDAMTVHFLGTSHIFTDSAGLETAILNTSSFSFFDKAIHHIVTDNGEERGVVLAPDGTTVALAPLMLGIEAGLNAWTERTTPAPGLFSLTLGRTLGLTFLSLQDFPASYRLGPNGCWDNVEYPKMFKLYYTPTLATSAVLSGGMDGLVLGNHLSNLPKSEALPPLSDILTGYYLFDLQVGQGLDGETDKISPKRRQLSRMILEPLDLQNEVMETLKLVWKLEKTEWIAFDTGIGQAVKEGLKSLYAGIGTALRSYPDVSGEQSLTKVPRSLSLCLWITCLSITPTPPPLPACPSLTAPGT